MIAPRKLAKYPYMCVLYRSQHEGLKVDYTVHYKLAAPRFTAI